MEKHIKYEISEIINGINEYSIKDYINKIKYNDDDFKKIESDLEKAVEENESDLGKAVEETIMFLATKYRKAAFCCINSILIILYYLDNII